MFEERQAILVSKAVERVMSYSRLGKKEYINIEKAEGRYLAEDIIADHPIPPFDKAPLDGFAIQSEDTKNSSSTNPIQLEVVETIGAGEVSKQKLKPGQAVRIMTGAILPEGCDTIAMFELVNENRRQGKNWIEIKQPFSAGEFVSFKGEETKKGEIIVKAGNKITPGIVAVLATFGYKNVPVAKKPLVGVFATGTELLDIEEPLKVGKIRNSNAYMIQAQIHQAGGEPVYLGQLDDDFDQCYEAISSALSKVDTLVTTGGVSVGDFDFLPQIYEKLGANVLFNKIAMRPGSVTTVAELNGKLLFGLSGNPSACFVGFELYTRPWIKRYLYSEKPYLESVKGKLTVDFPKPNQFTRFIRSKLIFSNGKIVAEPIGIDKSQVVTSLTACDALVAVPGGNRGYKMEDDIDILLLGRESNKPFKDPAKLGKEK